MGLAENFNKFCNSLTIEQETRSTISHRYEKITQILNQDFWQISSNTQNSLYVGSYGRGTAVRGFSDLDMIFVLPYDLYTRYNKYSDNGQSALLQEVKKSLQKTYSTTDIAGDGQVVVIQFSDDIKFEIVPAFEQSDKSFIYPDSNDGGKWKKTNPRPEILLIKFRNILTNYNLKNLCRMIRIWKDEWQVPIGGLLIDTLASNFLMDWQYKNKGYLYYDLLTRDFFKYLSEQTNTAYWFAVGSKQKVWKKGNFEDKAKRCYNLALEAIEYESNLKWRKIYGTTYPI